MFILLRFATGRLDRGVRHFLSCSPSFPRKALTHNNSDISTKFSAREAYRGTYTSGVIYAFVFVLSKPNQRKEGPFFSLLLHISKREFPFPNTKIFKHETYYKSGGSQIDVLMKWWRFKASNPLYGNWRFPKSQRHSSRVSELELRSHPVETIT